MERNPVKSSNIRSIGYEPETRTLEIEFNNGYIYQYFNVPESIYGALMSAQSHGTYFHQHIKDGYSYKRIK
jgi:hypothetical protein